MSNNNITLEKLKIQEKTLIDISEWWNKEIMGAAKSLEDESNKLSPDFQKVEELQNKIEYLQKRGEYEQKEVDRFAKIKDKYLLNCLMSGCLSIKMDGD